MSCTNALPIKKSFQVMMKLSVSGKQATDSANGLFSPPPCLQVFDVQSQEKLPSLLLVDEILLVMVEILLKFIPLALNLGKHSFYFHCYPKTLLFLSYSQH